MKSLPIIDYKEEKIVKLLTELDFTRSYSNDIVWKRGTIEIITDYQISLSIRVYPYFVYTISLVNEKNIPENEIIDWLNIAEQIKDNIIYYKK